jgi:hypothetical protein
MADDDDDKPVFGGPLADFLRRVLGWLHPNPPRYKKNTKFLCDSCKYNDARYCSKSERPNAIKCPDYKKW